MKSMKSAYALLLILMGSCSTPPVDRSVVIPCIPNGKIGAADEFAFAMFPEETRLFEIINTPERKTNPAKFAKK